MPNSNNRRDESGEEISDFLYVPSRRRFLQGTGLSILTGMAGCGGPQSGQGDANGDTTPSSGEKVPAIEALGLPASNRPIYNEIGNVIVEAWQELGIDVTLRPVQVSKWIDVVFGSTDWDVAIFGWADAPERVDPDIWCYTAHHSEGGLNRFGFENEEYDAAAEKQRRLYDVDERKVPVFECQEIMQRENAHIPIASQDKLEPYNSNRFKNPKPMIGTGLLSFWNVMGIEPRGDVDTLRLSSATELPSINPFKGIEGVSLAMISLIYDRLMRIDRNGQPRPWMAEEVKQVDETTIEATIRDGLTFHDGEDVTVEDVVFSFEWAKQYSLKSKDFLSPIENIEQTGDRSVQFDLPEPFSPVQIGLSFAFVVPKHVWEGVLEENDVESPANFTEKNHVGSGPFEFKSWTRGESLKLTANQDYFTRPNIDELIYLPGKQQALYRQIETGETDMMIVESVAPLNPVLDLKENTDSIELTQSKAVGYASVWPNVRRPPLDDRAFRTALHWAIPKDSLVQDLMSGYGTQLHSIVNKSLDEWHNPDLEPIGNDVQKGREVLEEAGYTWDSDGKLHYPE